METEEPGFGNGNRSVPPPLPGAGGRSGRKRIRWWLYVLLAFLVPLACVLEVVKSEFVSLAFSNGPEDWKKKPALSELGQQAGLRFPDSARMRRFQWVNYYYVDFWRAEIEFPLDEADQVLETVRQASVTWKGKAEDEDRDDSRYKDYPQFLHMDSADWIGFYCFPSDRRLAVNAWMTTNGPVGVLVLDCRL